MSFGGKCILKGKKNNVNLSSVEGLEIFASEKLMGEK